MHNGPYTIPPTRSGLLFALWMLHGSLQLKNLVLGGSLFSKEDTLRLQGSTAMEPAHHLWLRKHILSYNKVAFLGDCQDSGTAKEPGCCHKWGY